MTFAEAQKTKTTINRQRLAIHELRYRKESNAPDSWVVSFRQALNPVPIEIRQFDQFLRFTR
jgi:hypothetical protein